MLVQVPCPLCGEKGSFLPVSVPRRDDHIKSYGAIYDGLQTSSWKVCGKCGFVHQNPRPSLEALDEYYRNSQYHGAVKYDKAELLKDYKPVAYGHEIPWLVEATGIAKGTVFDLGCGLGFALKDFRDEHGWECFGVEPDRDKSNFAIHDLGLANVKQGMFDAKFRLPGNRKVDLVFSHHVWEHIADFDQVMLGIMAILKPGGHFYASMPTYYKNRSHMSKLYLNSGHYSSFTHDAMSNLVGRYGFEMVTYNYYNRPGRGVTDDLQYLARYTGQKQDATRFFESPRAVQRYVNVINPLRSILFAPVYSVRYVYGFNAVRDVYIPRIKWFFSRLALLRTPSVFFSKLLKRLRR